jgi:hypothetical protein
MHEAETCRLEATQHAAHRFEVKLEEPIVTEGRVTLYKTYQEDVHNLKYIVFPD